MRMEQREQHIQAYLILQLCKEEDLMEQAKPFVIDKRLIYEAYLKVK